VPVVGTGRAYMDDLPRRLNSGSVDIIKDALEPGRSMMPAAHNPADLCLIRIPTKPRQPSDRPHQTNTNWICGDEGTSTPNSQQSQSRRRGSETGSSQKELAAHNQRGRPGNFPSQIRMTEHNRTSLANDLNSSSPVLTHRPRALVLLRRRISRYDIMR